MGTVVLVAGLPRRYWAVHCSPAFLVPHFRAREPRPSAPLPFRRSPPAMPSPVWCYEIRSLRNRHLLFAPDDRKVAAHLHATVAGFVPRQLFMKASITASPERDSLLRGTRLFRAGSGGLPSPGPGSSSTRRDWLIPAEDDELCGPRPRCRPARRSGRDIAGPECDRLVRGPRYGPSCRRFCTYGCWDRQRT